jgi:uncharacterized protein (UPF0248 family)
MNNIRIFDRKVYSGIPTHRLVEIRDIDNNTISYCKYYLDYIGKNTTILDIYTIANYRNKRYASYILNYIIRKSKKNYFKTISLDDMTHRFNLDKNLYINNGFEYLEKGFPEMIYTIV